jgi:hypothetical protein
LRAAIRVPVAPVILTQPLAIYIAR